MIKKATEESYSYFGGIKIKEGIFLGDHSAAEVFLIRTLNFLSRIK